MDGHILDNIKTITNADDYSEKLTMYEVARWSVEAYSEIPYFIITNCFVHCKVSGGRKSRFFLV